METKKCTKCGEVKPFDGFGKAGIYIRNTCIACRNRARAERYQPNSPTRSAWIKSNSEKIKAARLASYKSNRERDSAKGLAWSRANLEKSRVRSAEWSKKNPEKKKANDAGRAKRLVASYVSKLLLIPVSECPPELIELKREQLQIHRLNKQLKQQLKGI